MADAYATVDDVTTMFRALTADEQTKVEFLLPLLSDLLRSYAVMEDQDLDELIEENAALASVAKLVVCSAVQRILRQSTTGEATTQESQSALGYSWSGTYAVPGGGYSNVFLDKELAMLGLLRQTLRSVEYDYWNFD